MRSHPLIPGAAALVLLALCGAILAAAPEGQSKKTTQTADMSAGAPPPALKSLGFTWPRTGVLYSADGAPMILVPAGPFMMGSSPIEKEAAADERPAHAVTVKAFLIDRYEITEAQYRLFLEDVARDGHHWCDPTEPPGKDHMPAKETWNGDRPGSRQPVVGVDWYDAAAYCAWAGKRLPSEAEWEKAARGTDERKYPWGDRWDRDRANTWENGKKDRLPVGSYEGGASPFGAEDLAGNVWEWVQDWYSPKYYLDSPKQDPGGPAAGSFRVVRGGSFLSNPTGVRASARQGNEPAGRYSNFGFRCAMTPRTP